MKNTFYTDGNYQDAQMPIADYVNMKMGWNETNSKATITKADGTKKNLRGSGAKDRGREGGNFSGDNRTMREVNMHLRIEKIQERYHVLKRHLIQGI